MRLAALMSIPAPPAGAELPPDARVRDLYAALVDHGMAPVGRPIDGIAATGGGRRITGPAGGRRGRDAGAPRNRRLSSVRWDRSPR